VAAMLPPRPFRGSGKVAQTACNSDRREGKSCILTLNQTFADSRILKISKFPTFRIAGKIRCGPKTQHRIDRSTGRRVFHFAAFLSLTPGPSPFSSTKITPADSSLSPTKSRLRSRDHRSPDSKVLNSLPADADPIREPHTGPADREHSKNINTRDRQAACGIPRSDAARLLSSAN
jgi:hypothetical protein